MDVTATEEQGVTARSIDPIYNDPQIEVDEWRSEPVPHRYLHGIFAGTEARFSFYLPPAEQYGGRIFHNTYPMALSADIGPFPIEFEVAMGDLGFTLDSGAAYLQTNNGGLFRAAGSDPAIAAYRVNAAAAKFARTVLQRTFGEHRVHAYLFGGSGGAYQVLGAAENTRGVWDGFVPFVPGCNHAISSMFTARMHALRVLRQRDRFPGIVDAMEPGGSGDPYAELNEEEAAALREVSLMGHPLTGWYAHETLDSGYFANISGMMPVMDPDYAADFWSQPGYLGTDPHSTIAAARAAHEGEVAAASDGFPKIITVTGLPEHDWADAHLVVLSGAATGATLPIKRADGETVALIATADPVAAGSIAPGDRVRVDNGWTLALQTYHRHQVPPTRDYIGWNQFCDAAGAPIYPQRPVQIGPTGTANAAGAVLTGRFHGKVLMLSALTDIDAYAWQADWYRELARSADAERAETDFALYYIDHAHHENPRTGLQRAHVVSYGGALQQALRDVAAWVEEGRQPPGTRYRVVDSQVEVPDTACERGGIQPVVTLRANGGVRAEVRAGDTVTLSALVEAPPGAGQVVSADWDFAGVGDFVAAGDVVPGASLTLEATCRYDRPGTYFPVLRVGAHRSGDQGTPYARVQNLGRARVVVT